MTVLSIGISVAR